MKRMTALAISAALLTGTIAVAVWAAPPELKFTDVRAQTKEFLGYEKSIDLTPEQEAIKREALTPLPAPCCSDKSQHTCCCPCNMSRTVWGLANYLIARQGYDAIQTRAKVSEWTRFINPAGYPGDTCYKDGGCAKP